jgi:hypothetical protein
VLVFEGTLDAMAIAVTALRAGQGERYCPLTQSGRELSGPQLEYVLGLPGRVVLAVDGDEPGRDTTRRVAAAARRGEAGHEASPLAAQLARRSAAREALRARLAAAALPKTLSTAEIAELLAAEGGSTNVLRRATPADRAAVYATLGVRLVYDDRTNQVNVTADLGVSLCVSEGGLGTKLHAG